MSTPRHLDLGARLVDERQSWSVLADPAESPYCITDRDPFTGSRPVDDRD